MFGRERDRFFGRNSEDQIAVVLPHPMINRLSNSEKIIIFFGKSTCLWEVPLL
jgi:hypothetical protein